MTSILFVCLGNICRSPMAEAVFEHLIREEQPNPEIRIDSAGIGKWHIGKPPHDGTLKELKVHGIEANHLKARQLTKSDLKNFDWIIAMDSKNMASIRALASEKCPNLHLLTEFSSNPEQKGKDLPDPFHTNKFPETYIIIEDCCRQLLQTIKQQ